MADRGDRKKKKQARLSNGNKASDIYSHKGRIQFSADERAKNASAEIAAFKKRRRFGLAGLLCYADAIRGFIRNNMLLSDELRTRVTSVYCDGLLHLCGCTCTIHL